MPWTEDDGISTDEQRGGGPARGTASDDAVNVFMPGTTTADGLFVAPVVVPVDWEQSLLLDIKALLGEESSVLGDLVALEQSLVPVFLSHSLTRELMLDAPVPYDGERLGDLRGPRITAGLNALAKELVRTDGAASDLGEERVRAVFAALAVALDAQLKEDEPPPPPPPPPPKPAMAKTASSREQESARQRQWRSELKLRSRDFWRVDRHTYWRRPPPNRTSIRRPLLPRRRRRTEVHTFGHVHTFGYSTLASLRLVPRALLVGRAVRNWVTSPVRGPVDRDAT